MSDGEHGNAIWLQHRAFWEKVCENLYQSLLAYARRRTNGRDAEAKDLVQETVCRILERLKDPATIKNPFWYLARTLRNIWIDKARHEHASETLSLDQMIDAGSMKHPAVESDVFRKLEYIELLAVLGARRGPLKDREELLIGLYLRGYTCKEIAARLNEDVRITRSDLNAVKAKVRYRVNH